MIENAVFIPGTPPGAPLPLDRFLPPVHSGSAVRWLSKNAAPGSWLIDPFGASPHLALELAQAGYRVLIAANNPVTRFILEILANRPSESEFTTSLVHLANARVQDERLEPHLLSLYDTPCTVCSQLVSADEFLWEKDAEAPFARIFSCPNCGAAGEYPTTPFDTDMAKKTAATRLNYARILERVAGLSDPDRKFAEEAIRYYPPRAVYALGILINKLETFSQADQKLLSALLLTAFDQTNTLWPYPSPRPRPRQLTIPPRFRERNVFRVLEMSIKTWANPTNKNIPLVHNPDELDTTSGLCVYRGAMRDLAPDIPSLNIQAVVTVIPRPNQAFWKLSALWAGWLGGRAAVRPFKPVLRRQRYDWRWHTSALHAALSHLVPLLPGDTPYFTMMPETEPGLLTSGLLASRHAGLAIKGLALREADEITQVQFAKAADPHLQTINSDPIKETNEAALDVLRARGEPASILPILGNVLQSISLPATSEEADSLPADGYTQITEALHESLTYRKGFLRYNAGKELDIGSWWLRKEPDTIPLGDRVESSLRQYLQANPGSSFQAIDQALCKQFPGLMTPDQDLVAACVESYAASSPDGGWKMRTEDDPKSRRTEINQTRNRIIELGERLGFRVTADDNIRWAGENSIYFFHITTTAEIGSLLQNAARSVGRKLVVLPGSRSNLILYKRKRDPRIDYLLKEWYFLKFRHLRALSANPLLDQNNVEAQFLMDELTYESPQLKLL